MNLLKYKTMVVGGGIVLVLAGGAVFGLVRFQGIYAKAESELKSTKDRLDRLNRRNPFPSEENITVVQQNRDRIKDFVSHLQADFRTGQVAEETMEPAQFAPLLEKASREVFAKALAAGVKLPERFGLGFGRYMAGQLPSSNDIPRLVVQARSISTVCGILFEARISELVSVERTGFEGQGGADTGVNALRAPLSGAPDGASTSLLSMGLPPVESNALFSAERIAVSFLSHENAAWEVLNGLARSPLFAVVKHVEFANEANAKLLVGRQPVPGAAPVRPLPGTGPGGVGEAAPGSAPLIIYPRRDERVLAGRENVRVSLVVDVFRFAGPTPVEGRP